MLRPLRSEFYRLRRRWMPWVLLAIIVVAAFAFYELIYFSINTQLQMLRSGNLPPTVGGPEGARATIAEMESTLQQVTPSHIPEFGIAIIAGIGAVILIVFAASHMGTDYGWGTLRTLLASGESRTQFLVTKLGSTAIFAAIFTIAGVVAVIGASYLVSSQAGFDTSGIDIGLIAVATLKTGYCFMPYLALAALIALVSRSSGAGIAAGLVIYFAESIAMQVLISFNKDYATIANLGISRNTQSLSRLTVNVGGQGGTPQIPALPDQTQAAIVIAVWTALFIAIAFWRLRTRDVTLA